MNVSIAVFLFFLYFPFIVFLDERTQRKDNDRTKKIKDKQTNNKNNNFRGHENFSLGQGYRRALSETLAGDFDYQKSLFGAYYSLKDISCHQTGSIRTIIG